MATREPVAVGRGVEVRFETRGEQVQALAPIDVEIRAGALTVLSGPSGSGKSMLLRLLGGLVEPTGGVLRVLGVDHGAPSRAWRALRRDRIAIALPAPADNLVSTRRVGRDVRAVCRARGERSLAVDDVLGPVGLAGRARARPADLSGRAQQRVAVALATFGRRDLVLLDEPTSELDDALAWRIVELLADTARAGTAVVVATHDQHLVGAADAVVALGSEVGA